MLYKASDALSHSLDDELLADGPASPRDPKTACLAVWEQAPLSPKRALLL